MSEDAVDRALLWIALLVAGLLACGWTGLRAAASRPCLQVSVVLRIGTLDLASGFEAAAADRPLGEGCGKGPAPAGAG